MAIGDEALPADDVDELVERCGDGAYVSETLIQAKDIIRKNGKSKVPLILDELNVHAARIEREKLQPLISGIFGVADIIHREDDTERGGPSLGDTHMRIHWLIRRLTYTRCSLSERSEIFLEACRASQLGWVVNFVSSAIEDHVPRDKSPPEPPEKCLVEKKALTELRKLALGSLERAAEDGCLIVHPQLAYLLFRWAEIANDDGVLVKAWTEKQLGDDIAVAELAKAFTGESWSQFLSDRVATRHKKAAVDGLGSIMDVARFRNRLEELETSDSLDEPHNEYIHVFLNAWRVQESDRRMLNEN